MAKHKKAEFIDADDFIAKLPADERAQIEARAKELIAEELTLSELRQTLAFTQERVADVLGVGQEHVSRLERKNDMLLTSLASYVRAMGGSLDLVVKFPDRGPVSLLNLANPADVDLDKMLHTPRAKPRADKRTSATARARSARR